MAGRIAEELLRVIAPHQPCRLTRVRLKVGVLRQAVEELLRFALGVALKDTAAEGAEVTIEPVPAGGRCEDCGREFTVEGWVLACPACGSGRVAPRGGDELIIETVTLEKEEPTEDQTPWRAERRPGPVPAGPRPCVGPDRR